MIESEENTVYVKMIPEMCVLIYEDCPDFTKVLL